MQNAIQLLSLLLVLLCGVASADDLVLHDSARNRDLPLRIYRPTGKKSAKYPVVIFSHGAGGSMEGYQYFGEYLAAHGMICIHPTHLGTDASIFNMSNRTARRNAIRIVAENPEKWKERILDIKFLLDSLAKAAPDADQKKVALAGHSFGAMTTMMLAGATTNMPGAPTHFGDDRLKAFIAISPQGPGVQFPPQAASGIKKPVMIILGSEDRGLAGQPIAWRMEAYKDLPPGDKYMLYIEGATHMSFADHPRPGSTGDPGKMQLAHEYVQKAALAFLKKYLLKDAKGNPYLNSNGPGLESQGSVRLEHK